MCLSVGFCIVFEMCGNVVSVMIKFEEGTAMYTIHARSSFFFYVAGVDIIVEGRGFFCYISY